MNFTPVLDELLICQIASTHHENTEFDHCFSPKGILHLTRCHRPGEKPVRLTRRRRFRSGPSDSHHDLPELTVLLEIAVRIRHLVEGEGTVNHGLERPGLKTCREELDCGLATGLVPTCEPDVVRLDGWHLGDHSST